MQTMWPGSQPPNVTRPRRRKGGKRRINAMSATARLMLATARRLEVAPKAKRTTEVIPRCLTHACEELGFLSPWDLAIYLDELARRSPLARRPPKKGRSFRVRLPPEKRPPGARLAVGVRCARCAGRGCLKCEQFGWGVLYTIGITKREHGHKCTPAPAIAVTSTPNASPAPTPPAT
jgi:hypothetical protein